MRIVAEGWDQREKVWGDRSHKGCQGSLCVDLEIEEKTEKGRQK